jgi:hypothetical protein
MSLSVNPVNLNVTLPLQIDFNYNSPRVSDNVPSRNTQSTSTQTDSTATVSGSGSFLSRLAELKVAQPQTFQNALTQAASGLSAAANQAGTSTPQGQILAKSAAQIQQVANTGDVSQLQPTAVANAVQRVYGPNQADAGQGVLSLLSNTNQSSTGSNSTAAAVRSIFSSSEQESSAASSVGQIITNVLQNLHKALSQ